MTDTEMEECFRDALKADPYDLATHYAFADWLDERDRPEEADIHREWTPEKQKEAEEWLDTFALECWHSESYVGTDKCEVTRDDLVKAGHAWLDSGDYWVQKGDETAPSAFRSDEFWPRFVILTCRVVPEEKRESFVSCTC